MAQMTNKTDPHAFHTMSIAVGFSNGALGSLVGSYDTSYAYPDSQWIEINDTVQRLELSRAGEEARQVWEPGYFNDRGRTFTDTFDRYVEDMLAALRAGEQPPVHARAGQRAVQLGAASVRSFEEGVRVTT